MDSRRRNGVYPFFLTPSCIGSLLIAAFSLVIPVFPITFVFNGFSGTNMILMEGAAHIRSQSVLALTNDTRFMLGQGLYSIPVQMKTNGLLSSFSTNFVFSMVPPHSNSGGHGLAFVVTPYRTFMGSLASEYLGLLNDTSNGKSYNHLWAIEFDMVQSVQFEDPDGNHVAPEITRTGKATPSSDVFSFGVLLLEVASGRKPVDLDAEQLFLV